MWLLITCGPTSPRGTHGGSQMLVEVGASQSKSLLFGAHKHTLNSQAVEGNHQGNLEGRRAQGLHSFGVYIAGVCIAAGFEVHTAGVGGRTLVGDSLGAHKHQGTCNFGEDKGNKAVVQERVVVVVGQKQEVAFLCPWLNPKNK